MYWMVERNIYSVTAICACVKQRLNYMQTGINNGFYRRSAHFTSTSLTSLSCHGRRPVLEKCEVHLEKAMKTKGGIEI
jgi:hypothetical protein